MRHSLASFLANEMSKASPPILHNLTNGRLNQAVATKELFDAARDGQEDLVKKFIADEADVDGCKDEVSSFS
jgi:hypothetical protein